MNIILNILSWLKVIKKKDILKNNKLNNIFFLIKVIIDLVFKKRLINKLKTDYKFIKTL